MTDEVRQFLSTPDNLARLQAAAQRLESTRLHLLETADLTPLRSIAQDQERKQ